MVGRDTVTPGTLGSDTVITCAAFTTPPATTHRHHHHNNSNSSGPPATTGTALLESLPSELVSSYTASPLLSPAMSVSGAACTKLSACVSRMARAFT